MTDNVAKLAGFTKEVFAESDEYDLYLLVKPDADLNGTFKAWDTDEQAFVSVNGWLFSISDMTTWKRG